MFTGLISAIGVVTSARQQGDLTLRIACEWGADTIILGESIACNGACLTVVNAASDAGGDHWFEVELSTETVSCTAPGQWQVGTKVNLERALKMGDALGGHLVTGHVDGLARLLSVTPVGDSHMLELQVTSELARFIAAKGSVTLDGVSLTVNRVEGARFWVNIIPHTWQATTLGKRRVGDNLNMEVDLIARYLDRLMAARSQ